MSYKCKEYEYGGISISTHEQWEIAQFYRKECLKADIIDRLETADEWDDEPEKYAEALKMSEEELDTLAQEIMDKADNIDEFNIEYNIMCERVCDYKN